MSENYLEKLNDEQRDAVLHTDGPVMVLAGAGSGKTRVLTFRVAHLINQGVNPARILALTFTNKAAKEMKERIKSIVGNEKANSVWMGTFHSIFARILKIESELIGYSKDFSIYDTEDSKNLIKNIVKDMKLDDKIYNTGYVLNRISAAKMNLIDHEQYAKDAEIQSQDIYARKPLVKQIYAEYYRRCRRSNAMDFDDLLFNTNLLFYNFPQTLRKYQERFEYVLVDEYQDTNIAQYFILKKLAELRRNICVVGDDAQSIYGFRGASIQNILNFNKDYPDLKIFKLEQNYRSTKRIIDAANSVIENNKNKLHKLVWTDNDKGEPISVVKAISEVDEALIVANSIFHTKMTYRMANSDFAVLYRTNAQSRVLEDALRKLNIPYRVYGGMSFYKRKEVKDLIAYFKLIVNPSDNEAFYRIVNYPARGIGNTTLSKITLMAEDNNASLWDILCQIDAFKTDLASSTIKRLTDFRDFIISFQEKMDMIPASELANQVALESGLIKTFAEDQTLEGVARLQNIESLLNGVVEYENEFREVNNGLNPTLSDFLQNVSLLTSLDEDQDKENTDFVSLMTVHAAKGLEFPYIYVVGMEENLFPSSMSMSTEAEIEEERRLFYVAITRAMKKLTLSYADTRTKWGEMSFCTPSRFVDEIDDSLFDMPQKVSATKKLKKLNSDFNLQEPKSNYEFSKKKQPIQPVFRKKILDENKNKPVFSDNDIADIELIAEGVRVEHVRFGVGTVALVEGSGQNKKAIVEFDLAGKKQLVLKFAKLKLVEN